MLSLHKLHTVLMYEKLHSPSATLPRAVVDELRYHFHHPLSTHARQLARQLRELTIDEFFWLINLLDQQNGGQDVCAVRDLHCALTHTSG